MRVLLLCSDGDNVQQTWTIKHACGQVSLNIFSMYTLLAVMQEAPSYPGVTHKTNAGRKSKLESRDEC